MTVPEPGASTPRLAAETTTTDTTAPAQRSSMITVDRMAAVDRNAEALGVSERQLMESAGNAVARAVREAAPEGGAVTILGGRGNNGGDAFVAARFLDGYDVSVVLLGRPENITTHAAEENWEVLESVAYDTRTVEDSTGVDLDEPDVIVDGLLGTGVRGAPREPTASAVRATNRADATVVSVDVPSGVDADTGEAAGVAVDADRVVTFHDRKPGLATLDADVTVADIGIPPAAARFVGPGDLQGLERASDSHKGENGEVLVIGGGPYTGAPALAAQASLRAGADLAYVAVPEAVAREVQGYSENLIVTPFSGDRLTPDHVDDLLATAGDRDVVVFGPGLGGEEATLDAVREFLGRFSGTAVVDADALQVVPEVDTGATLLCTPHQGELRKMGGETADDWRERADLVEAFAADIGHVLLVKGKEDVVSDGEQTRIGRTGTPAMTVGGTGDVLAGVTGALAAVLDPFDAAAVAAYANGRAGERAAGGWSLFGEERQGGLVATDLLDELPEVLWGDDDV